MSMSWLLLSASAVGHDGSGSPPPAMMSTSANHARCVGLLLDASSGSAVAAAPCTERRNRRRDADGHRRRLYAASPCTSPGPRSFVASERLGLEPGAVVAILEDMGDLNRGRDALDPALHAARGRGCRPSRGRSAAPPRSYRCHRAWDCSPGRRLCGAGRGPPSAHHPPVRSNLESAAE